MRKKLESCAALARELEAARDHLRPLLLRASRLGGDPTLDNAARNGARDVEQALDELIRQVGVIAVMED